VTCTTLHRIATAVAVSVVYASQSAPASGACRTTVAAFLDADGGLERDLSEDFLEFTTLPRSATNCVDIAVQFRRGGKWYRLWRNNIEAFQEPATVDDALPYWSEMNSREPLNPLAHPGSLSSFILAVAERAAAPELVVVIGAHGNATREENPNVPPITGTKTVTEDGTRSMGSAINPLTSYAFGNELRAVMGTVSSKPKLTGIGFDACQLASLETQYEVFAAAEKREIGIVASQENQDGPGWLHSAWPQNVASPFADAVVEHGVTAWHEWLLKRQQFGVLTATNSVSVGVVAQATDALGVALSNELSPFETVNKLRCACPRFPDRRNTEGEAERLVDIACLAAAIADDRRFTTATVKAAQAVSNSMKNAVRKIGCAPTSKNCPKGLTVFLPNPKGGAVDLSGYKTGLKDAPRFVHDPLNGTRGGWAKWIDLWKDSRVESCK
jgi:hypothetical protein